MVLQAVAWPWAMSVQVLFFLVPNWVPVGANLGAGWCHIGAIGYSLTLWNFLKKFLGVSDSKNPPLRVRWPTFWAPFGHLLAPFGHLVAQIAPFRAHFGPKVSPIVPNCPSVLSWGFNLGSIWVQSGFFGRPRLGCLFGQPKF